MQSTLALTVEGERLLAHCNGHRMLFSRLIEVAKPLYKDVTDPAHTWDHIERSAVLGQKIAIEEGADVEIVVPALLFHDCVKDPLPERGRDMSAEKSAEKASHLLFEISEFPHHKIKAIQTCIAQHSFSLGIMPQTLEGKIVQDADRLDSLGPIGMTRIFANGGAYGRQIYCPEDPLCENGRQPEPTKYIWDWIPWRMIPISQKLHTQTAKEFSTQMMSALKIMTKSFRQQLSLTTS